MKRITALILALFTLSGVSGLVYEIVWIRLLGHLLGGTSFAISTVLAVFMGGLALGSRHFGRRVDAHERPLRLYARLEFGIAALGLAAYVVILFLPPVYAALARVLPAWSLGVLRVLIAVLLLLPPTFCMGGTLPVLSRFVIRNRDRLGRGLGLLYGLNTLGAVFGCFLTGFVLVAWLGLRGSTALAIGLNLLIGLAVLLLDRGASAATAPAAVADEEASDAAAAPAGDGRLGLNFTLLAMIFALSGFASLGLELYWTRALQHFLGNSTYAFSAMLTTFLLGLALGGWFGGWATDRARVPARLLGWVQIAIGVAAMGTAYAIWNLLPLIEGTAWLTDPATGWREYVTRRFLLAFAVMLPATFLVGMTFPIVNRIGIARLSRVGSGVGRLYFVNTVGSILGSLAAGYLLLPWLGPQKALVVTACLSATLGLCAHLGARDRGPLEPWAAAAIALAVFGVGPWVAVTGQSLLSDTQSAGDAVLFDRIDHTGETRVYRKRSGALHMSVDGYHIGGTEASIQRKEKILAHLPMALAPEAENSLSIGLGSGVTLGALAAYEELKELVCVEIVPGVVEGAALFGEANHRVLRDPRVHIQVGDGVQYLLTSGKTFDIISSDSKLNPEYSGNAPLLSTDYYELCRGALSERGVMVQWLAIHVPAAELQMITRSFMAVFPCVNVFFYDPSNFILAGSKSPLVFDMDAVRRYAARPGLGGDLQSLQLEDPYLMATLFLADRDRLTESLGDGDLNTWERPRLEFSMVRQYRLKSRGYHEDDNLRWIDLLHRPEPQLLAGEYDVDTLARFRGGMAKLLEGYAVGGGVGHLSNAVEIFREGLAINPGDRRLEALLNILDLANRNIEAAIDSGELDSVETLLMAGMNRIDAGELDEAMGFFDRALAMSPGNMEIKYNILLCRKQMGPPDAYMAELDAFRADFPDDARGYSLMGRVLVERGDLAGAEREFRRSVELDPENHVHLNNLASLLTRMERWSEAADLFAEIAGDNPAFRNAALFAAASYSMADRCEEAARWMRVCLHEELATRDRFAEMEHFANLRASEFWERPTDR